MSEHGRLLHNMSAPPHSVVKYSGLADLRGAADSDPGSARWVTARPADAFGTAIRFVLPDGLSRNEPTGILVHLGVDPGPDPDQQLSRLIDERAEGLPLPDGCVVVPAAPAHRVIWSDALSALAVLAKCSTAVWLRAKTPSLRTALARREVSLLVPPAFAARLPEARS